MEDDMKRLIVVTLGIFGLLIACRAVRADFEDEFPGPPLNPGWRILHQDSTHWSLTARPGYLQILTQFFANTNGTLWNTFYHRETMSGYWMASTRIVARPDSIGQAAMLYAEYDSTNTGLPNALVLFGNEGGVGVVYGAIGGGAGNYALYSDTVVYLRVRTFGNIASADYSPNGISWTTLQSGAFPSLWVSGVGAANLEAMGATSQTPPMAANFDWFHLNLFGGVESGEKGIEARGSRAIKAAPNPFASFARVPGHEGERFALYDVSGRQVGNFPGDRIGEGLSPGVYFLKSTGNTGAAPLRIVKLR
jgi:hypothetical protein